MARLSDVPIGPLAPILPFPGTSDKLLSLSERFLRFHQTVPVSNLGLKDIAGGR
jgi:hypothetical protein